jgi:predicted secreted protein
MLTAKVGDVFTLDVQATPTTGYQWQPADLTGLELVSTAFIPAGVSPGSGGVQRFRLRATAVGRYVPTFQLKRAWETSPIDTRAFEVDVIPA